MSDVSDITKATSAEAETMKVSEKESVDTNVESDSSMSETDDGVFS